MKNFSEIQALLDRYWEAETSLDEERMLKEYFNSGQIDDRLRAFLPLFQSLKVEQQVEFKKARVVDMQPRRYAWHAWTAAASLALLLTAGLWWWTGQRDTAPAKVVQQTPSSGQIQAPPTAHFPQKVIAQATPATRSIRKQHRPAKKTNIDPETEKAMEEIKAALALVSSKIGKGKQEAAKGSIYLENVDKLFKKKPGAEG